MKFSCSDLRVAFTNGGRSLLALDGLSFESREGEFLSIIGPSGCGKTTLLRAIAGILAPDGGAIRFGTGSEAGCGRRLMVYQENSLFPWMTVLENAAFAQEMNGVARERRTRAARELLAAYGMLDREGAYPYQISAGMKQRVAVIRAFLGDAGLLLMDEPFGALDTPTRLALQDDLLELWRRSGRPVVFVTHDVDEAIYLSDRVLVMSSAPGRVVAEVDVDLPRECRREAMLGQRFLTLKRNVLGHLASAGRPASVEECLAS